MKKKIAIYGGSFNPCTNAHKIIVENLLMIMDEVWIMPVAIHPWNKELIKIDYRMIMLDKMFQYHDRDKVKIVTMQSIKGVPQTTMKFMRYIREGFKEQNIKFFVVIGSDNAEKIEEWSDYKKLIDENDIIIMQREKSININTNIIYDYILLQDNRLIGNLSSTDIRKYVKLNKFDKIRGHCDINVIKYIKEKGLYE